MKSQSLKLFAATFILGLATIFGTAGTAAAQAKLSFETTFDFHLGKEKLAAGKYEMVKISYGKYLLRNTESKTASLVLFEIPTSKINRNETESVIFNRYGEIYFLSGVFDKRGEAGRQIIESKYEREIRKGASEKGSQLADKKKRPAQVTINLMK